MQIKEERIADIRGEIEPLLMAHFDEVNGEDPLVIDYEMALKLEQNGNIVLVVAREDGRIVGYTFTLLSKHPRHECMMADCKAIYVAPECRGIAPFALMKESERTISARAAGPVISYQSFRIKKDIRPFLEACGYEVAFIGMQKRI